MASKRRAKTSRKKGRNLLQSYLKSIFPPYSKNDFLPLVLTFIGIVILYAGFQPTFAAFTAKANFSSLTASLKTDTATFGFAYSASTPGYKIDVATSSNMKQNLYRNFGTGPQSPIVINGAKSIYPYYTCGRRLYWIAKATGERSDVTSSVQTAMIDCSISPTPTPIVYASPTPIMTYSGACIIRDAYTNMPTATAPDLGKGYAKLAKAGINTISELQSSCTQADFAGLLQSYCTINANSIQQQVVTYGSNAAVISTSCGAFGCNFVTCP